MATMETLTVETACGWKGSFRTLGFISLNSSSPSAADETTGTASSFDNRKDSECTAQTTLTSNESSDGSLPDSSFDDSLLGGEPNLLDAAVERQGVQDILAALTASETKQFMAFDSTMPIRHLRAEKGDVSKAIKQMKETLQWRLDFGVDVIVSCFQVERTERDTAAHAEMRKVLSREAASAKVYARGYDREGRAFMYMTPARENTHREIDNMRHLVFNLEKTIACTARKSLEVDNKNNNTTMQQQERQPLEKVNALIDYEGFKMRNSPPMSTIQYTLDILQKHYPERMRHFYLLHPPFVFKVFWSMVRHFVDPVSKEKIVFCAGKHYREKLLEHVSAPAKLEVRAYGSDPDIREFAPAEYLRLPWDVSFDE